MLPENQIICGDCLDVMKDWPVNCVDLVLTDPPYNGKDIGPHANKYDKYIPLTESEYKVFCQNWWFEAMRISPALLFTSGISNTHFYPAPKWQICWHKPASVSYNRLGGYNAWEPVLFYGKAPKGTRLGQDFFRCDTENFGKGPEHKEHPCPKPLKWALHLVRCFTEPHMIIADCFSGTGAICVAAKMLGRRYIGIDISERYCEIARMRLKAVDTGVPVKEQLQGQIPLWKP